MEEFMARHNSGTATGLDVRVRALGSTQGMLVAEPLMNKRAVGAEGKLDQYVPGHGGDVWFVKYPDGSGAPYTVATELEPKILKPSLPKGETLSLSQVERPLTGLKIGDQLQTGMGQVSGSYSAPRGFLEGRNPWQGYVELEHAQTGSGIGIPGRALYDRDGIALMKDGKVTDIDPTQAKPGDQLMVTNRQALDKGVYTVRAAHGMRNNDEQIFGDLRVKAINGETAQLEMVKPLSGNEGIGNVYTVPTASLKEPFFRRIDSFAPKAGEEVVVPKGTRAPNYHDPLFESSLQGRKWSVLGEHNNGVVLGDKDEIYLVPQNYFNTRTMFPLQEWLERTK
jgi:hypothetical protein